MRRGLLSGNNGLSACLDPPTGQVLGLTTQDNSVRVFPKAERGFSPPKA